MKAINHIELAKLLRIAKAQAVDGVVLRTGKLPQRVREVLRDSGWLREIFKGYALLVEPSSKENDETLWQGNYWTFLSVYLQERFGNNYVLSPDNSLDVLTASNVLPKQVIAYATKGGQATTELPHNYSIFTSIVPASRMPSQTTVYNGLRVMPMEIALARAVPVFFEKSPANARVAFISADVAKLAQAIAVDKQAEAAALRIFHGLRSVGRIDEAKTFTSLLQAAGFSFKPAAEEPAPQEVVPIRTRSPYAARIFDLWAELRGPVVEMFPAPPDVLRDPAEILKSLEDSYVHDAYHSLSIEGYRVSEELIERIARGEWNPDAAEDKETVAAMAAKGYYEAFQAVKKGIAVALENKRPVEVVQHDFQVWYAKLFSPSVHAGILTNADLIGYRNGPVYIRTSMHVPPQKDAVPDAIDALFACLLKEENPAVRAVLGHLVFTYIHPYTDGNGRIGRFLMNFMLVTAGYPWTIIRSNPQQKTAYLSGLEQASVHRNIVPLVKFIIEEMNIAWSNPVRS